MNGLETAVVAFGSAVAGALLGAVVGFMGALQIENRRESRRRQASIRGLIKEITLNAEAVHVRMTGIQEQPPLSDALWGEVRFVAALYLDDDTYDAVFAGYSVLPLVRESLDRYRRHHGKTDFEFLTNYTGETLKAAQTMLEQQLNADTPFSRRLWNRISGLIRRLF